MEKKLTAEILKELVISDTNIINVTIFDDENRYQLRKLEDGTYFVFFNDVKIYSGKNEDEIKQAMNGLLCDLELKMLQHHCNVELYREGKKIIAIGKSQEGDNILKVWDHKGPIFTGYSIDLAVKYFNER